MGRSLGCHPSVDKANAQIRAIGWSKHRRKTAEVAATQFDIAERRNPVEIIKSAYESLGLELPGWLRGEEA